MTAPSPLPDTSVEATRIPRLPASPLRFTLQFARRFRWWYLLIASLQVLASICAVMLPYALGKVVGVIGAGVPGSELYGALALPLGLFLGLSLAEVVFSRSAGFCRVYVAPLQRTRVSAELFAYLQHHSQRYISSNFAGSLASRVSETAMGVNMTLWALIFDFLPVLVTMGMAVVLLATASGTLALFALLWSLAFVGASYLLARRCQPYSKAFAAARSETTGRIVDAIGNLSAIRLFARIGFERRFLQGFLDKEVKAARNAFYYNEKIVLFQFLAALVLKVGLLFFAVWLWRQDRIDVAGFVMSTSLSFVVIAEARNISRRFLDLFEYIGNIENGVRTIIRPHDIVDAEDARDIEIEHGSIELQNVGFAYEDGQQVFDGLDLKIPGGQRVGLVGYSGSGKSTLLGLIMRLHDPQQGRILIDGEDIRHFRQQSLHSQISLIPQDPSLFHRSLLDNIRYGDPEADREAVEAAARQAYAHDFIQQMQQQYDSLVGERGVKLSGGQRQRIAIARVIVKNAPILIMDEATSSLDSLTEKAIQDALEEVMRDKTVIVVAHRLSTVASLDRILFFDNGRIVEDGSPQELLACPGGAYRRLWEQQVNGMLPERQPTPVASQDEDSELGHQSGAHTSNALP
ncbi:ABC transporter ATP-binding protein [Stutzerimonas kirkiae]|uniref:ABC transporter ATP-binding protein n=1 Tax=Stutzerimonas kirkiae TaxID=2211392 RepID=UPI0010385BC4|nr:ABC transporter ATP-binding protein [Stutzerimonas kirkiae]TBV10929.1 ABC transporter ATP-binding protein [Stutzerimonas kirkiae]